MKSRYPCQDPATTPSIPANTRLVYYTVMLKWKPPRRKRRQSAILTALAALLLLLLTFHNRGWIGQSAYANRWTRLHEPTAHPLTDKHVPLWKSLYTLIRNNHPQCKKLPDLVVPRNADIPFDPSHDHPRPDVLWLEDADIARLRSAHANFVSDIQSHHLSLGYEPGTRGIVTIASEPLLAALTTSLRMLRRTSSTLPVEIFLRSPSPQSNAFCTNVFPSLDARCFYLSDIFAAADTPAAPSMHQSKVLAIIFSTFEEVLFLDPCSFPLTAPEPLFHAMPFIETGLILWPDFWYASESPYFFDIAKISDVPSLNIKAATEAGEIMYSKSKHAASLMLATYYNFYGPDYYYLLQSQGGPGAGEKETFGLAATALNKPTSFVNHAVHSLGRHNDKGDWLGTAMIQFDPVADFFSQSHNRVPVVQPEDIAHPPPDQQRARTSVEPMFIRVDFPKFDPQALFQDDKSQANPAIKDANGSLVRSWMDEKESIKIFGGDLENCLWKEIEASTCGPLLGLWLEEGTPDRRALDLVRRRDTKICEKVRAYNKEVFGPKKG